MRRRGRQAEEEAESLRTALSDAHAALFEERHRAMELSATLEAAKAQELADRARIKHLHGLIVAAGTNADTSGLPLDLQPRRQRPVTPTSRSGPPRPGGGGGLLPLPATSPQAAAPQHPAPRRATPSAETEAEAALFLPASDASAVLDRLEAVEAQAAVEREFANERIAALLEDRKIRESDAARAASQAAERVSALQERLQRAEVNLALIWL